MLVDTETILFEDTALGTSAGRSKIGGTGATGSYDLVPNGNLKAGTGPDLHVSTACLYAVVEITTTVAGTGPVGFEIRTSDDGNIADSMPAGAAGVFTPGQLTKGTRVVIPFGTATSIVPERYLIFAVNRVGAITAGKATVYLTSKAPAWRPYRVQPYSKANS